MRKGTTKRRKPVEGELLKEFGTRLRELREKRGLTQEELAEMSGVFKGHLLRYEHGRSSPTAEKIVALAQALRVSTDALLRGDRKGEEPIELQNIRLFERFRALDQLPKGEQETVLHLVDAVLGNYEWQRYAEQRIGANRTAGA